MQYAAEPVAAVKNMSQLVRPDGLVSLLVWGPPAQCESGVMFTELGPLLPPGPRRGARRHRVERGRAASSTWPGGPGSRRSPSEDVPNPLIYPDLATAVRTQLSSGPARAAIQHSGLAAVRGALTRAFAGSRKPDGSYRQENVFRYLVART